MKKRRVLSVLLAAALTVGAVPVGTSAEEIILDESTYTEPSEAEKETGTNPSDDFIIGVEEAEDPSSEAPASSGETQPETELTETESETELPETESEAMQTETEPEWQETESEIIETETAPEELETETEDGFISEISTEEAGIATYADDGINDLDYNTYYNIRELSSRRWDETFTTITINVTFPQDGRVKIKIEDCNKKDCIDKNIYINAEKCFKDTGVEEMETNWTTIKAGSYSFELGDYGVNKEAKIIVLYEEKGEYTGEVENNDTFDTANLISGNAVYEGNYSKSYDVDYYKFVMKQAGLAEISITGTENVRLYEEDENENVYEIREIDSKCRVRLHKGTYFIKIEPEYDSYNLSREKEYTVCVNRRYESSQKYEQEDNNVASQANKKNANQFYIGNLNTYRDIDWYQISVPKQSFLSLVLKTPRQLSSNSIAIELYDSKRNRVLLEAANTTNPYLKTDELSCPAGVYYVKIYTPSNYTMQDYSFCLNQREVQYVTGISMSGSRTVMAGTSFNLNPTVRPWNADDPALTWRSTNPSVASVSEDGVVSANSCGTARIVATASDRGKISAVCTVTVRARVKYHLNGGVNNPENPTMYYGGTYILQNPTRRGYLFKGWYEDEYYWYRVTRINSRNVLNTEFYAMWEKVSLARPRVTTLRNVSGRKISLKYAKVSQAEGYEIVYATNRQMIQNRKVMKTKLVSKTISGLALNRTYYVQIRAYRKDSAGQLVYSSYSTPMQVKIQK